MRTSALLAAAFVTTMAACLTPVDPSTVDIERVVARVGQNRVLDTIQVRHTARVYAAAYAREGYDVGLTTFTFTSSDPSVATVDSLGTVVGVAPGTVTITAATRGLADAVTIVVVPSTIAYTLEARAAPRRIAFSSDYTRAYVVTDPDSLIVFDALAMYRLASLPLPLLAHAVTATASHVFVTHPNDDSVTVISAATSRIERRMWVGAGPVGAVALGNRAFIAARFDRKVVILDDGAVTLGIPMAGEPHELAIASGGRRLFATVERANGWWVVPADPSAPDTLTSFMLSARPTAIATSPDGSRVYVLLESNTLAVFTETASGGYQPAASVPVGANAGGVSATGRYVVVSGNPTTILDATTLEVLEEIPGAGAGFVQIRPDGVFVFIADGPSGVVKVIAL